MMKNAGEDKRFWRLPLADFVAPYFKSRLVVFMYKLIVLTRQDSDLLID